MLCQDDLQVFSLISSIFPIFIFYFKTTTLPTYDKRSVQLRKVGNILLGCWIITLSIFALLYAFLPTYEFFGDTLLHRFMMIATYTQFWMVSIITMIFLLNNLSVYNLSVYKILKKFNDDIPREFLSEWILPKTRKNRGRKSWAEPSYFTVRCLRIFVSYWAIFFLNLFLFFFNVFYYNVALVIFVGILWLVIMWRLPFFPFFLKE